MRVLLIEDDDEICQAVEAQLLKEGYSADICNDGAYALHYALKQCYDVIILDRLLPGLNGISILQNIRKNNVMTPVIMATAMGSVSDRITGLDCGADDYIIKPFDLEELTARIRALTRRPANIGDLGTLSYADLTFSRTERELSCLGKSFHLSKRESLLMEFFMQNPDKTLPRELIFMHVWGSDSEVEDGNLDNYVHFLRKRIKSLKSKTEIRTIYSAGYRLQKLERPSA